MRLALLIPFFLFANAIFSQKTDSLVYDPEKKYTQKFMDSIIIGRYTRNIVTLTNEDFGKMLRSDSDLRGWVYYYARKASKANREKKYDSSLYYAEKSIKSVYDSKVFRLLDEKKLTNVYTVKGHSLYTQGYYKKSIVAYQKALDLIKKHPYIWESFVVVGIADNHYKLGNDSLALKYMLQVSKDSLFMGYNNSAIRIYKKIGSLYQDIGNTDMAKKYFEKSLEYSENSDYKISLPSIYGSLGSIFLVEKNVDSTVYYYKKAVEAEFKYNVKPENHQGIQESSDFRKEYIAVIEGDLDSAIRNLKELVKKINSFEVINIEDKDLMVKIVKTLGMAYEKQGNSKEYQKLLEESFTFLERFHQGQLKEDLQNLETQYQTKEKDFSIVQLEQQKEQQDTIIKQQRAIAIGLVAFSLVLSGLGYLLWRQRKIKTQYEKENLEQRLLRSQMNPHFIGNAMNTISALVVKKSENTIPYIKKLSSLFRLVLTNSREEFVSLEDEITIIKNYLELQSNFSTMFDFSFLIDENIHLEEIIIPPMLIQPLVENAIVHGLAKTENKGVIVVEILVQEKKGLLLCRISDNGIGYQNTLDSKNSTSVSGDIIKERLVTLKRKFKVDARIQIEEKKKGVVVELYLPFLKDE
ncbi:MAG: histidine kinase [Cellulophaga sp.]